MTVRRKKRHYCRDCGAQKYAKYLEKVTSHRFSNVSAWRCRNREKCSTRSPNYKK